MALTARMDIVSIVVNHRMRLLFSWLTSGAMFGVEPQNPEILHGRMKRPPTHTCQCSAPSSRQERGRRRVAAGTLQSSRTSGPFVGRSRAPSHPGLRTTWVNTSSRLVCCPVCTTSLLFLEARSPALSDAFFVDGSLQLARSRRPDNQAEGLRRLDKWHTSGAHAARECVHPHQPCERPLAAPPPPIRH